MNKRTLILVEMAMSLALAFLLSHFRLFRAPFGGSVTLAMIPIVVIGLRWGWKVGFMTGFGLGMLRLMSDAYVIHWSQFIFDYPLAFSLVGLSGLWQRRPWLGTVAGFFGRYVCHVIVGATFFASFAPEGIPVLWYSLVYNSSYLVPEFILTGIIAIWLFRRLEDVLPAPRHY